MMNVKLLINIAKALLLARWKQTLVAAIGVTFGITMFVALLSFMTGLNDMLDGLILNRTPHVRLFNEVKPNPNQPINSAPLFAKDYNFISTPKASSARLEIYNIGFIMQSLARERKVLGYTPRITAQAFFNYGTLDLNGIVNGIDVQQEMNLFAFKDYVIAGNPADLKLIPNSIILGKALAETMLAKIGDVVTITTAAGSRYSLKLVGIFQSGINELDKVQSYASISTTQKILNKPKHYVTDVAIRMKDINDAPAAARQFAQVYQTAAEDIQTANAQFETGTRVRMIISYAVGITLLIVAGFGIFNILNMMIYEKMDSIAILKATGFSGSDVKKIFLMISLGIGFFGGLAGLLFGFLLSQGIHTIPFNTEALPTVKTYPINNDPVFYMIAISFSLITTYFAGLLPARKAGKVDPVVIIHGK